MGTNYCSQCGSSLEGGAKFCPNCGQSAQAAPTQYGGAGPRGQCGPSPPGKEMATWSLVFGVLSLVCIGLLGGIPGIVMGISAKNKLEAAGHPSDIATAGIVVSAIGSAFWIIVGFAIALQ